MGRGLSWLLRSFPWSVSGLNKAAHSLLTGTFLRLGQSLMGSSSPNLPGVSFFGGGVPPRAFLRDLHPPPPSVPVFSVALPVLFTAVCLLLMSCQIQLLLNCREKISLLFTNLDPYNNTVAFSLSCPSDAIWVLPFVISTCTLCAIMLSIVMGPFLSLLFIFHGGYFSSLPCLTLSTQLTGPFPNSLCYCHFSFLIGHLGPILVFPWCYP